MSAVDHEAAVARLLADLGDTADAVADRLRALGIKGKHRHSYECPVAKLLHANGYPDVEVDNGWTWPDGSTDNAIPEVANPAPVGEFIQRFDAGVYLDLVEVAGD